MMISSSDREHTERRKRGGGCRWRERGEKERKRETDRKKERESGSPPKHPFNPVPHQFSFDQRGEQT